MRNILVRGAMLLLVAVSLLGLKTASISAQQANSSGNGFRISPVRAEYVVERGKSTTLTVTLENPSDSTVTAKSVLNDFVASDKEDGEPRLILDENAKPPKNSFRNIASLTDTITLAPKQQKDITVTIRVPSDANAGGYYGAVRFIPVQAAGDSGNVGLSASVGTIVLVRVPGQLTEKAKLEQLSAAKKNEETNELKASSFFASGDVHVMTRVNNLGDIHVAPFGRVVVKNMFGKTVSEYELNPSKASILPGSIRRYEQSIEKPKSGWLGRYTINANIGYTQGSGDILTLNSSFWYLPGWAIAILVLLAAGIAGAAFWIFRKFNGGHKRR